MCIETCHKEEQENKHKIINIKKKANGKEL